MASGVLLTPPKTCQISWGWPTSEEQQKVHGEGWQPAISIVRYSTIATCYQFNSLFQIHLWKDRKGTLRHDFLVQRSTSITWSVRPSRLFVFRNVVCPSVMPIYFPWCHLNKAEYSASFGKVVRLMCACWASVTTVPNSRLREGATDRRPDGWTDRQTLL